MLNTPWIDPRKVDWTNSPNPLRGNGWGPDPSRNPYMFDTLTDPIWEALKNAQNVEPRIWVVPDPIDEVIAGGSTYDESVPTEPNTWLWGLNCYLSTPTDEPPSDFYLQISDAVTGATVFSQQVHASNIAGASGAAGSDNGLIYYLSSPRVFLPPSYPIVRIVNLSANPQKCNVNLFCSVEMPY